MSYLHSLVNWIVKNKMYFSKCESIIEFGVLDNPGWILNTRYSNECLAYEINKDQQIDRTRTDWVHIFNKDRSLLCVGGLGNLIEIFNSHSKWMKSSFSFEPAIDRIDHDIQSSISLLIKKLPGIEHQSLIKIILGKNFRWNMIIDLSGSEALIRSVNLNSIDAGESGIDVLRKYSHFVELECDWDKIDYLLCCVFPLVFTK